MVERRSYFTIADNNNLKYYEMLKNSLAKFTSDPLILIDEAKIKQLGDPHFFYRSTPIITKALFKDYDAICHIDADCIVTGSLDHIWEGEWDVAVTKNSNPRDDAIYPIRLLDISPYSYVNNGFNVFKSKSFIDQWLALCMSEHFPNFQFREQDFLNLLVFFFSDRFGGPYRIRFLDDEENYHNLGSKGYWPNIVLRDNELFLPPTNGWPDKEKKIKVIHFAGGNTPNKANYHIYFQDEVVKYIDKLVKP